MKTVMIVEDEKLIRQGLTVMIKRSGVPVEKIIECSNGIKALEVLEQEPVDVMFTDIRMPKMDGIELVKRVQELPEKPIIVAVSGFDDFNYAVEMLRNGVREYLLKPVERAKVREILTAFDEELCVKEQKAESEYKIGIKQLEHLLMNPMEEEERKLLSKKYEETFLPDGYRVFIGGKSFLAEPSEDDLFIEEMMDSNIAVVSPNTTMSEEEDKNECLGISQMHQSLGELHGAYMEAIEARKRAFFSGSNEIYLQSESNNSYFRDEQRISHVPEGLRADGEKAVSEESWTRRIHLVGTDRNDEMDALWHAFFHSAENGYITPQEFEDGIAVFLDGTEKIYRNYVKDQIAEDLENCRIIYDKTNVEEYKENLYAAIKGLQQVVRAETSGGNQQKIKKAVEYIHEHYREDLNMAVVSNYVSMNYSLFSYELKQYTGSTFVKLLKEIRMEEAKKLLAETDLKIIEISQKVGYENDKYFMKTFRSVCGVSPSEYRRITQQE